MRLSEAWRFSVVTARLLIIDSKRFWTAPRVPRVVDTDAMVAALREGRIAGAGLDVFDAEPEVPQALKALDNVVLTPHVAGQSPEAARDTVALVLRNLQAFFAGEPVLTPVRP